jgi:hypothetical protein
MSLTNIKLPDLVIADLYRQSLVQDGDGVVAVQEAETPAKVQKSSPVPEAELPVSQPATAASTQPPPVSKPATPAIPQQQPGQPSPATKGGGAYKVLGNNKRNISVVVHFPNEVFVPESDLQFLTKMLSACKLNLADVAIVNHATSEVAIDQLKEQLRPLHVLLFGVEPTAIQLPISFPAFKEQAYAGTTYLFAPGLSQLNQENEEAKVTKRKLWDCLKRMFV